MATQPNALASNPPLTLTLMLYPTWVIGRTDIVKEIDADGARILRIKVCRTCQSSLKHCVCGNPISGDQQLPIIWRAGQGENTRLMKYLSTKKPKQTDQPIPIEAKSPAPETSLTVETAQPVLPWQQQIRAIFEPGDYLHIFLIHGTETWKDRSNNLHPRTEEHWDTFEGVMDPGSLKGLKSFENKGWNIYVCTAVFDRAKVEAIRAENDAIQNANANLPEGQKKKKHERRVNENIATADGGHVVRTVAIDCDENGEASLAKIHEAVAAGTVPAPTLVIRSSTPEPGTDGIAKYHVWWAVKGFTLEQQAAMNTALQQAFGGDCKAKDTVRVLRLAGFVNNQPTKYPHKPVATIVESSSAGRYTLDQFKLPLDVKSLDPVVRPKASSDQIEFIAAQTEENAVLAGFNLGDAEPWKETGIKWVQDECPNADAHTTGGRSGSCAMVMPSGARDFTCLHTHCAHLNWTWFKNHLDELAGKPLDWRMKNTLIVPETTDVAPTADGRSSTVNVPVPTTDRPNESVVDKILKMDIVRGERGLVDLFDGVYGDKFAHVVVKTKGEWMTWNGKIWVSTTSGNIRAHAVKLADLLKDKVYKRLPSETEDEYSSEGDGKKKEKSPRNLMREIIRSLNKVVEVNKVVTWMESRREMPRDDFDKKPHLFNFNNGTFDLDKLEFRGFNQEDYLTQISSVSYHPDSKCPTFDEFLTNAFPSREMREYLQRYFGYCLSGTATEKAAVIFHGLGDNGKTVLLDVLMAIFGYEGEKSYGKSCSWATFDVNKSGALTIRDDLARLHNARLVVCDESDKRMEIAQALFKAVTGGSLITSRGLFRDLFTYVANFKVILATNHRPKIVGDDGATWSRIQDVPMKQSFRKGHPKRIDNLKPRLMAERQASFVG